jgi:hypothetical protein
MDQAFTIACAPLSTPYTIASAKVDMRVALPSITHPSDPASEATDQESLPILCSATTQQTLSNLMKITKKRGNLPVHLPMTIVDEAIVIVINTIAANFVFVRPQKRMWAVDSTSCDLMLSKLFVNIFSSFRSLYQRSINLNDKTLLSN